MNADDRATQAPTGNTFTPQPATGATPAVAPTSGATPQRTSLRSGQIPTRPVTGETPVAPARTSAPVFAPTTGANPTVTPTSPFAPTTGANPTVGAAPVTGATRTVPAAAPAEEPGKVESAFGKIKAAAVRTKDDMMSADPIAASNKKGGPRKVRVLVSRIDPWSALKIGFLLSIAAGIMLVVAVFVLWTVLNQMGVWTLVNDWILKLFPEDTKLDLMSFFDKNKIMAATTLIAVVNVVLLTALSTISAFLYNVISSVVGGFYVTLTDD
ncbi:DUF3566 domain-containing protein [Demequina capsici]|uniref:DUF3566 domain-containing protein n=1 Tax=Demequina capsici TaxID=3075620 RepID=A0AA96FEZ6_9MICO|nr:DUF3566 domain-containing protein [Demequina sp. PMTSA13]WNM27341.1 DUF3566 domain-containing protein [Demequina sp. PMTSA13]